jgi:tetratricopeptide (TPR) repeat protein
VNNAAVWHRRSRRPAAPARVLRAVLMFAAIAAGCATGCATTPPPVSKIVGGRIIQSRAIHPDAYERVARAQLFEDEERWEEALGELERALELDHDAPEIHARIAELELSLGRTDRAARAASKSLSLGETTLGLIAHAHVRQKSRDPAAAIAALRRAADLTSFAEEGDLAQHAYLELADAQIEALDLAGARATLEELARSAPESSVARIRLASVLWTQGAMTEVERRLRETLTAEPNHIEALLMLAWAATAQNRFDEGRARFAEALERAEGALDVATAYARFLLVAGRQDEASQLVDDLALTGDDQNLLERIELCRAAHESRRGLALAEDRRNRPDIEPELAARLDRAIADLRAEENPAEAITVLLRVPKTAPSFTAARLRAAELAREAGQLARARQLIGDVEGEAASDDLRDEIVVALSTIDERDHATAEALSRYAGAIKQRPNSIRLRLGHAALLERLGRVPEALAQAVALLDHDPGSAEALNFWGFLAADHGIELPLAVRRIAAALAFDPGSGAIIDSLGWAHLKAGRLPEATQFLEQAGRLEPEDPEILAHLATLYEHKGQPDRALLAVRKALGHEPSDALKRRLESQRQRLERSAPTARGPAPGAPAAKHGGGNGSGAPSVPKTMATPAEVTTGTTGNTSGAATKGPTDAAPGPAPNKAAPSQ